MSLIRANGGGLGGAGSPGGALGNFYSYQLDQSLRFDDDSNTFLNRTPSSTTNQRTWTYSFWFKHGSRTSIFDFLLANSSGDKFFEFSLTGAQKFQIYYHDETLLVSSAVLRDRSAWYHIVLRHDTTQSTADHRLRIYVNGSELTAWDTNGRANLPQNFDGGINESGVSHLIGQNHVGNNDLDGYIAEVHFVDGSSLAPSSFGETKDEIWIPVEYSGSHGTNGWHLDFADSSDIGNNANTTDGTNDWTPNNFAADDVVLDSPTNNFCTWNPLYNKSTYGGHTYAEGNLKVTTPTSNYGSGGTTFAIPPTGKWYAEVYIDNAAGSVGIALNNPAAYIPGTSGSWYDSTDGIAYYSSNGFKYLNASSSSYGASFAAADIIGIAVNADDDEVTFYKNNSTQGAISKDATGYVFDVGDGSNSAGSITVWNFGQDSSFAGEKTAQNNQDANGEGDFYYSPPSGFLALCSQNLDTPDIIDGTEHFETVLYSGNSSTQSITSLKFSPDFVWTKRRSASSSHYLSDSVRGGHKVLFSELTAIEYDAASNDDGVESFDSNGFTLKNGTYVNDYNASGSTYVAWSWLAGTAFSNDASATSVGTIDSSGEANTTAGFSIVSYTGTGSAGTIKHGLSAAPEMLIVKNRDTARDWMVYHSALGATKRIWLNYTYGEDSGTAASATWNDTAPTSTVFSIGTNTHVNDSGDDHIVYCFHSVEGYSKVGSYVGNGSADGINVHTGFRPAFVLLKKSSASGDNWSMYDNKRDIDNAVSEYLIPNSSDQAGSTATMDFVSNGFKIRNAGAYVNTNTATYIYLAFAEAPFKFANAR